MTTFNCIVCYFLEQQNKGNLSVASYVVNGNAVCQEHVEDACLYADVTTLVDYFIQHTESLPLS
jgi:hypothetical protein